MVDGLLKFKYDKDHLCFACEQGKSKKATHPPKLVLNTHSKLELIHMDLCELMRVESINGKRYILVIVDDYSRYTWVYFHQTKDEAPEMIKKFIAQVQLNFNVKIQKVRIDNGTEFKNVILQAYYENKTARLKDEIILLWRLLGQCLSFSRRKPNVEYFHVFEFLCYPTNDREDLEKLKPKVDIGIFIGYSESSRGFQIYNRRTGKIMETIHVKFDELTAMDSEHNCLKLEINRFNNDDSSADYTSIPSKEDLDHLFGPMYEEYFKK
ncbi:retrovirus-related pol polyprotein from transposon TNT 1-94 [Tanacetum coccineum]|uniref:Retrovirus-related pol polyprotein from transposon TNT 1-94 n=1 Tax=Tanacetum coccineum TaxID=301880 RepID=A0ABQ5ICW1_9ASTR